MSAAVTVMVTMDEGSGTVGSDMAVVRAKEQHTNQPSHSTSAPRTPTHQPASQPLSHLGTQHHWYAAAARQHRSVVTTVAYSQMREYTGAIRGLVTLPLCGPDALTYQL